MLRYYTDDSPGLKITPVCLFTLVPVYTLLLKNVTNRVSCLRKSCLTLACSIAFEGFFFSRRLNQHLNQVVVLIMSVCFIAFVTMLHAVAKLYQYRSSQLFTKSRSWLKCALGRACPLITFAKFLLQSKIFLWCNNDFLFLTKNMFLNRMVVNFTAIAMQIHICSYKYPYQP